MAVNTSEDDKQVQVNTSAELRAPGEENAQASDGESIHTPIPWGWKLGSVVLVSCINFGSSWSSGVIGAMKTDIKKQLKINNAQFAVLSGSEDFMKTVLMLVTGMITDRLGGAGTIFYGNLIYTIGSILVASAATVRNYHFWIGGQVILSFGDIATQVAQYKIFSSWFPPNNGFASTLGFELAINKIGGFVGKSTANVIATNLGFSWTFWMMVIMNVFTNIMTVAFYIFTRFARTRFVAPPDPATGEQLTENNKKFEIRKSLELPWVFWGVLAFSMFETSTALVFSQNATELAEQRFNTDSITAGWYTSLLQYAGFFIVPLVGLFIDIFGNRLTLMAICGGGVFISMALLNWAPTRQGTAAAFGIYACAFTFGPTVIIDSIRTSMWHQSVFGSAYALKIMMNNCMNIIIGIASGVIQDNDNNSFDHVVILYLVLAGGSLVVTTCLIILGRVSIDLGRLQWTRKQRLRNGHLINERREKFYKEDGARNRRVSWACLGALGVLTVAAWVVYFWGLAEGHNDSS